jgi:hypothetical protein
MEACTVALSLYLKVTGAYDVALPRYLERWKATA